MSCCVVAESLWACLVCMAHLQAGVSPRYRPASTRGDRGLTMHGRRVRHVLCEPEGLQRAHTTRKEGPPVVAEDDDAGWDLVERKEAAQELSTLAGIDAGLALRGSH